MFELARQGWDMRNRNKVLPISCYKSFRTRLHVLFATLVTIRIKLHQLLVVFYFIIYNMGT